MENPLIIEVTEGLDTPVKLEQTSKNLYTVTYGLQITEKLDYFEAMRELTECVGHSLECASKGPLHWRQR